MTDHPIISWNAIIPDNFSHPCPVLYIKPKDPEKFLDQAKITDYTILLTISGTNSIYDGKKIPAIVNSSVDFPIHRPNFYNKNGYLTILLNAEWHGYPSNNGKMTIDTIELSEEKIQPENNDDETTSEKIDIENYENVDNTVKGMNSAQVGYILLTILVIFCVFFYISFSNNK